MTSELLWWLIALQIAMGAFDGRVLDEEGTGAPKAGR
jgi:hypothetical protein